jgi:ribosomal protein S18 acetylase RimI-like enzyme
MRPKEGIYPYDPAIDRQFIVDLFKDKEEWYWLMSDYSKTPIEYMIDTRSPGDKEYQGKLNIRTYRINNKPVAFSASYNKELLEGSILFISVHKDHRRKGLARKLTLDAMDQLKKGGAEVIRLWTRADNVRSRSLYDSLGFKIFWTDGAYVRYEKYLKAPASMPTGNPAPA